MKSKLKEFVQRANGVSIEILFMKKTGDAGLSLCNNYFSSVLTQ